MLSVLEGVELLYRWIFAHVLLGHGKLSKELLKCVMGFVIKSLAGLLRLDIAILSCVWVVSV
jgi:hypothetical protein